MKTLAKENMSTQLITVTAEASLAVAYEKMRKFNIRHLPVVDITDSIVGILSDRDLQRAMISEITGAGLFARETCEFNPDHTVRDYMNYPVKTVNIQDPLRVVTEKMLIEKVSAYLVLEKDQVAGIITTDDLLGVLDLLLKDQEHPGVKEKIQGILANPNLGKIAQIMSDVGV